MRTVEEVVVSVELRCVINHDIVWSVWEHGHEH